MDYSEMTNRELYNHIKGACEFDEAVKELSRRLGINWMSYDTLDDVLDFCGYIMEVEH